jgi:hypothetical protein
MIDIFEDLKDELQGYGIEFSHDFKADHQREGFETTCGGCTTKVEPPV